MHWDPRTIYLGQDPIVRDQRDQRDQRGRGERPIVRDHRGDQPMPPRVPPLDPRVTPPPFRQPQPDPRVTTPPFPQPQPDPRVTTRPEDLYPRRDEDRDRDRGDRDWERRRRYQRHRRFRDQYDLPWGHRYYRDYVFLGAGYGWLPRWFPYWDPAWLDYWWFLFDYYGGDAAADYAAYARDAVLRGWARRYGWL